MVGTDGHLYWIIDAYTTSDRYPYSEPIRTSLNYMRNPVKVVVDAYDGTLNFYVVEEDEPIYSGLSQDFSGAVQADGRVAEGVLGHIRYPTDLFSVQAEMFRTYHMTNPIDFYNREDVWAWPKRSFTMSRSRWSRTMC